jgi:hypothetical protein
MQLLMDYFERASKIGAMKAYRYSDSKKCVYCGIDFFPRKTILFSKARFCSRLCACRHVSERVHSKSKKCKHCGKDYFPPLNKPFEESICCSKPCTKKCLSDAVQKCKLCGKEFRPKLYERTREYCGRACCSKATMSSNFKHLEKFTPEMIAKRVASGVTAGKNNGRWKGGRYTLAKTGVIWIRIGTNNYRPEHLVVAEKKLGRPLKKGEVVHHLNLDASDNSEENLYVCRSVSVHSRIHQEYGRLFIKSVPRNELVSVCERMEHDTCSV